MFVTTLRGRKKKKEGGRGGEKRGRGERRIKSIWRSRRKRRS